MVRISYSTYLIHWPIIVFWCYLSIEPLSLVEKLILFLLVSPRTALHSWSTAVRHERSEEPSLQVLVRVAVWWQGSASSVCLVASSGLPGRLALVPRARWASRFRFSVTMSRILHIGSRGSLESLIFEDSMVQATFPRFGNGRHTPGRVDIVSRGGCVLAKDAVLAQFGSKDEPCRELRDACSTDRSVRHSHLGTELVGLWQLAALGERTRAGTRIPGTADRRLADGISERSSISAPPKNDVVISPPLNVQNVNPIHRASDH